MKRSMAVVLLVAFPLAAAGKLLPEAEKFAECLLVADWTLAAGEAVRGGISQERHVAAQENEAAARRAAIEAVYRDRPRDLSDYIAAKLGSCLRARGVDAADLFAKACYDETLWARMLFASKRRGVELERVMKGPLAQLAEAVYSSDVPEAQFRRDLIFDCLRR